MEVTNKDVCGLEVAMQNGWLAGVEMKHPPGNGFRPASHHKGIQFPSLRCAMEE